MNEVFKKRNHHRKVTIYFIIVIFCPFLLTDCNLDKGSESTSESTSDTTADTATNSTGDNSAPLEISVSTSRVSGIAPLSVFFE